MEALSRETLENMMAQAVAHATTYPIWPQGEAPEQKIAMRYLRLNPGTPERQTTTAR